MSMTISASFLLIVMWAAEPQQIEQQMQRQQQQLDQIKGQMDQQRQQLDRLIQGVEAQSDRRNQKSGVACSVEMRRADGRLDGKETRGAVGPSTVVPLNLLSTVSRPAEDCLPAEVRVTATYLDSSDNFVCSGTVENIAVQTGLIQNINLELRPANFGQFVRWKNEPPQINSGAKRLFCLNLESTAEATTTELEKIFSVRIRATVLPSGGGMSSTEIQLNLR
jgi:hypothetical protein